VKIFILTFLFLSLISGAYSCEEYIGQADLYEQCIEASAQPQSKVKDQKEEEEDGDYFYSCEEYIGQADLYEHCIEASKSSATSIGKQCIFTTDFLEDSRLKALNFEFTRDSFKSSGKFKEQCRAEAALHPNTIKLSCELIEKFDKFFRANKEDLEAAALYSDIYDLEEIITSKGDNLTEDEALSCGQIFKKLRSESCNGLIETIKGFKAETYIGAPLFQRNIFESELDLNEDYSIDDFFEDDDALEDDISADDELLQTEDDLTEKQLKSAEEGVASGIQEISSQPSITDAINDGVEQVERERTTPTPGPGVITNINQPLRIDRTTQRRLSQARIIGSVNKFEGTDRDQQLWTQSYSRMYQVYATRSQKTRENPPKESLTRECQKLLESTNAICENKLDRKTYTTDNELYRKFFAKNFAKTLTRYKEKQNANLKYILFSTNYLFCSAEDFDPPLTFGEGQPPSPITRNEAFGQKKCKSYDSIISMIGTVENSLTSTVELAEEIVQSIRDDGQKYAKEFIESEEGRQAISKTYEDAGLESPEYLKKKPSKSEQKVAQTMPTTSGEIDPSATNTITDTSSTPQEAKPSSDFSSSIEPTTSFGDYGNYDIQQPGDSEKEIENKKKIQSKKEEFSQIEDQYKKNQTLPGKSEENEKLIEDLRRLEKEMMDLRAENKRLAELRLKDKENKKQKINNVTSSGQNTGNLVNTNPGRQKQSPTEGKASRSTAQNGQPRKSFSGSGLSDKASSNLNNGQSKGNYVNSYGVSNTRAPEMIQLEENEKLEIREKGVSIGNYIDQDRNVKVTFIEVKDKEGYVTTWRIEKNENGEETFEIIDNEEAKSTLMAMQGQAETPDRKPASKSEKGSSPAPINGEKLENSSEEKGQYEELLDTL
tara:strand:+ start:2573 stop:5233 length:2661 start_codon:yes stop_codon:yes gene_type:complete